MGEPVPPLVRHADQREVPGRLGLVARRTVAFLGSAARHLRCRRGNIAQAIDLKGENPLAQKLLNKS
jgi:hypothetical protein